MSLHPASLALLLVATSAGAVTADEDAQIERARAEIERELKELVEVPPARTEITFEGVDDEEYEIVEAHFALDGKPLQTPPVSELVRSGKPLVAGELSPGQHVLTAQLTVHHGRSAIFTYVKEYKFKMQGRLEFIVQKGVRQFLATRIHVDELAIDPENRLKFVARGEAQQNGQWDDVALADRRGESAQSSTPKASPERFETAAVTKEDAAKSPPARAEAEDPEPPTHQVTLASGGKDSAQTVPAVAKVESPPPASSNTPADPLAAAAPPSVTARPAVAVSPAAAAPPPVAARPAVATGPAAAAPPPVAARPAVAASPAAAPSPAVAAPPVVAAPASPPMAGSVQTAPATGSSGCGMGWAAALGVLLLLGGLEIVRRRKRRDTGVQR